MRHRARWLFLGSLATICAACGGGGGPSAPQFTEGPVTPLGTTIPYDVAIGRFDGDAYRDLLLPGSIGGDVQAMEIGAGVFLGEAGGTFAARAPVTVGVPAPWEVVRALPGHFDDGARLDCVVVAGTDYGVLLGDGDGSFDAAVPHLSVFPNPIVATDAAIIDGDGNFHDDLVVGTLDGNIVILLGDGAGGFQVSDVVPVAPGKVISKIVVVDLNDDDIDDVVALDSASGITVLFGDLAGSATFGSSVVGGLPGDVKGILVGAFDDSLGLDLAILRGPIATPSPHLSITIVTGDGAGGFGVIDGTVDLPGASFGFPVAAAVVWIDLFGTASLVVLSEPEGDGDRSLYLVRTDGAGVPTAEGIPVPPKLLTFRASDFDDDWMTDLLLVTTGDSVPYFDVRILYGTPP
jgi:hypothetical protein